MNQLRSIVSRDRRLPIVSASALLVLVAVVLTIVISALVGHGPTSAADEIIDDRPVQVTDSVLHSTTADSIAFSGTNHLHAKIASIATRTLVIGASAVFSLYWLGALISYVIDSSPSPTIRQEVSALPLRRLEGFTCHNPEKLKNSQMEIWNARIDPKAPALVRFRRINVKYPLLRTILKGIAHHDWIQLAGSDHPEDERPLACFDPRLSDDDFNNEDARRRSGCWFYQERAQVLRDFLKQHNDLDAVLQKQSDNATVRRGNQWFAQTAKVLSFIALRSKDAKDFESKLRKKKFNLNKDLQIEQPEVERKLLFAQAMFPKDAAELNSLWQASMCILPMYGELGVQGHGIEDHLRYGRIAAFNVDDKHIIDTAYHVHPICARLAVDELIPLALNGYDNSFYKSSIRMLAHGNDFEKLGCSNPTADVSCQIFPRCWQMSMEKVLSAEGKYPECRPPKK